MPTDMVSIPKSFGAVRLPLSRVIRTLIFASAFGALLANDARARDVVVVSDLRAGVGGDRTRFVMDLTGPVKFSYFALVDPYRLVIDLPELGWQLPSRPLPKNVGLIKSLRYGLFKAGASRVVLDIGGPMQITAAFLIPPSGNRGHRLVVDMTPSDRASFMAKLVEPRRARGRAQGRARPPAPAQETARATPDLPIPNRKPRARGDRRVIAIDPGHGGVGPGAIGRSGVPEKDITLRTARTEKRRLERSGRYGGGLTGDRASPKAKLVEPRRARGRAQGRARPPAPAQETARATPDLPIPNRKPRARGDRRIIVIDPGHGGVDPGAIGRSGVLEKDITLRTARTLKRRLERSGRYRVVLTRDRDVFIRLRDRIAVARRHDADLFVSLHADSIRRAGIRGLSVYTLSEKASDKEAAELADNENKADLIAGIDLSAETPEVTDILIDLAQRETMNESVRFAAELVQELRRVTKLLRKTHRFAGFAVLKAPDIPSVLIEMGFLSNRQDERALRQEGYRARIADSVAQAIDRYFERIEQAER